MYLHVQRARVKLMFTKIWFSSSSLVKSQIYENMSRERIHHKERKRAPAPTASTDVDMLDDSSEDDLEPRGSVDARAAGPGTSNPPCGDGGDGGDDSDDLDSDYEPPGADSGGSGSSGESDMDDFGSGSLEAFDDYGLGDL